MNSSKNLGGKKVQNSNGKPVKVISKSVQQNLDNNLKKLTSQAPQKKITKTSGTTAKAKKPSRKTSSTNDEIKFTRSHKSSLFPHGDTFPWFLEDRKDDKRCWFVCYDHAVKYIRRYKLTKLQYKLVEQAS